MKKYIFLIIFGVLICIFLSCEREEPAAHGVEIMGISHKAGLADPTKNCTTCHGDELTGKEIASVDMNYPSCFKCHEDIWNSLDATEKARLESLPEDEEDEEEDED